MELYLTKKYHRVFLIKNTRYNYLSETYQSYAYPKEFPSLIFFVGQEQDAVEGYSDTYPKVFWESSYAGKLKAIIKNLYPNLDVESFKTLQIVERGEYVNPNSITYNELGISQLACSITINIPSKWETLSQSHEYKKMDVIKKYLKFIHLPVLVEIRYFDKEIHANPKVFFIMEDGRIIGS
jgi:hypothetical protein